ncbi:UNVERIFIED_ORG: hypothetical protein J2W64_003859 [Rahnella aquatilis]|uniref:DUF2971 domain-containing protein n=1 Tax=Rahnella sp. 2050 TaxID=3156425 RepID=UPI001B4CDDFC|nr:hypothetical protein [Rahnella aquatilis]
MILYKYVDLETARKILANHTVKFTNPYDFNDPFEVTSAFYESNERKYSDEGNALNHLKISMCYGILSLSRSPTNPLMWAHYGWGKRMHHENVIFLGQNNTAHGGMVIGIDINESGLNDEGSNIIPAKFGSVIYTTTKPTTAFSESENLELIEGMKFHYDPQYQEALQRAFLYKSSHWSYEEEVRVVRNIHRNCKGEYNDRGIQKINKNSIKEIYIGSSHSYNKNHSRALSNEIKSSLPDCKVLQCNTNVKTWDINFDEIKS